GAVKSWSAVLPRVRRVRPVNPRHLGGRPRTRILIEASTESEWVAQCLEELRHESSLRSELRADVCTPAPADQNRRTRRRRVDGSLSATDYRPAHRRSASSGPCSRI